MYVAYEAIPILEKLPLQIESIAAYGTSIYLILLLESFQFFIKMSTFWLEHIKDIYSCIVFFKEWTILLKTLLQRVKFTF